MVEVLSLWWQYRIVFLRMGAYTLWWYCNIQAPIIEGSLWLVREVAWNGQGDLPYPQKLADDDRLKEGCSILHF